MPLLSVTKCDPCLKVHWCITLVGIVSARSFAVLASHTKVAACVLRLSRLCETLRGARCILFGSLLGEVTWPSDDAVHSD